MVSAVVSWPATASVAIWSRSCSRLKPAPVSGSRAATSTSNRSRGGSGAGMRPRSAIIRSSTRLKSRASHHRAGRAGSAPRPAAGNRGTMAAPASPRSARTPPARQRRARFMPCEKNERPATSSARCWTTRRRSTAPVPRVARSATVSSATWAMWARPRPGCAARRPGPWSGAGASTRRRRPGTARRR